MNRKGSLFRLENFEGNRDHANWMIESVSRANDQYSTRQIDVPKIDINLEVLEVLNVLGDIVFIKMCSFEFCTLGELYCYWLKDCRFTSTVVFFCAVSSDCRFTWQW